MRLPPSNLEVVSCHSASWDPTWQNSKNGRVFRSNVEEVFCNGRRREWDYNRRRVVEESRQNFITMLC